MPIFAAAQIFEWISGDAIVTIVSLGAGVFSGVMYLARRITNLIATIEGTAEKTNTHERILRRHRKVLKAHRKEINHHKSILIPQPAPRAAMSIMEQPPSGTVPGIQPAG